MSTSPGRSYPACGGGAARGRVHHVCRSAVAALTGLGQEPGPCRPPSLSPDLRRHLPTATPVYEQITQRMCNQHMETGKKVAVVCHCLGGGASLQAPFRSWFLLLLRTMESPGVAESTRPYVFPLRKSLSQRQVQAVCLIVLCDALVLQHLRQTQPGLPMCSTCGNCEATTARCHSCRLKKTPEE